MFFYNEFLAYFLTLSSKIKCVGVKKKEVKRGREGLKEEGKVKRRKEGLQKES